MHMSMPYHMWLVIDFWSLAVPLSFMFTVSKRLKDERDCFQVFHYCSFMMLMIVRPMFNKWSAITAVLQCWRNVLHLNEVTDHFIDLWVLTADELHVLSSVYQITVVWLFFWMSCIVSAENSMYQCCLMCYSLTLLKETIHIDLPDCDLR